MFLLIDFSISEFCGFYRKKRTVALLKDTLQKQVLIY